MQSCDESYIMIFCSLHRIRGITNGNNVTQNIENSFSPQFSEKSSSCCRYRSPSRWEGRPISMVGRRRSRWRIIAGSLYSLKIKNKLENDSQNFSIRIFSIMCYHQSECNRPSPHDYLVNPADKQANYEKNQSHLDSFCNENTFTFPLMIKQTIKLKQWGCPWTRWAYPRAPSTQLRTRCSSSCSPWASSRFP